MSPFPILTAHWIRDADALDAFLLLLSRCRDAAGRKAVIVEARLAGAISAEDAALLITGLMLETA